MSGNIVPVHCSEKTRARGKVKSLVLAVASVTAVLAAPSALAASITVDNTANIAATNGQNLNAYTWMDDAGIEEGNGVVADLKPAFTFKGTNATVTTETSQQTALDANYTNTLTITQPAYSFKVTGVTTYNSDEISYNSGDTTLVLQDTDNTSNVTSATEFLKVTPKAAVANTGAQQGIGANTEYELSLDYNTTQFSVVDGKLSLADGIGGAPSTYFHVNNTTNTGTGDAATNFGAIDSAAGATGDYSVTAGVNATAANNNAIAIGHNAQTISTIKNHNSSISIGENATSWAGGLAMGRGALAQGNGLTGLADGAIAIGNNATVEGSSGSASASIAIGSSAYASAIKTGVVPVNEAIDGTLIAWNGDEVALGVATSVGDHAYAHIGSSAFGQLAYAKGQNATALGQQALAEGHYSVATGYQTRANTESTIAIGRGAVAGDPTLITNDKGEIVSKAIRDTAIGSEALANGGDSTALGSSSAALADKSIAIGYAANAKVGAANSVAVGYQSKAINTNGTAVGHASVVGDVAATAIGVGARAFGTDSFAAARLSRAHGDASNAIGFRAFALGTNSTAVGTNATAATGNSIAIGSNANSGDLRANLAVLNQAQADLAAEYLTGNDPVKIAGFKAIIAAEEAKLAAANAQNTIAIGTNTTVLGQESAAIGYTNTVESTANGTYVLGSNITATNCRKQRDFGSKQLRELNFDRCRRTTSSG